MSIFDNAVDSAPDAGTTDFGGDASPPADTGVVDSGLPPVSISDGSVTDVGGAPEGDTPRYLDVDEYGNHLVKVKVDGEEKELPFSEVRNGLMMQQAFTKRTQELAEERRKHQQAAALVAALEANPAGVLRELSDAYDLDPEGGFTPIERSQQEIQLRTVQAQAAQAQEQMAKLRLQQEIAAAQAENPNLDVPSVARLAAERNYTFTDAVKIYAAEEMLKKQTEVAETERRRQAAAAASGVTHNGGSSGARGAPVAEKPASSIREAFAQALASHR